MARLTDSGIEINKLEGILAELQTIARRRFEDLIDSTDELDVSESSILGRILGIIAEPEASNEELLLELWRSFDPDQAEGIYLDKILALLGIYRKGAVRGYAGLIVQGQVGTTLMANSLLSSKISGDEFSTTAEVSFDLQNANGIVINITDIAPNSEYSLGYTGSYGNNVFPSIKFRSVAGDTKEMLAQRFMETVNNSSKMLNAVVDNDDNVVIRFVDPNYVGNFTLETINLQALSTYKPVSAVSSTLVSPRQAADTLTVMQSTVFGWISVTNPFDSIESEEEEKDPTLRSRAKVSRSLKSVSNRVALYGDLFDLEGVRFVNIKENFYDNPTAGRSAKGISVVVLGGKEDEIAETINNNIPLGCATDGLIQKSVRDEAGTVDIRFSRPEFVSIVIDLSLFTEPNFPQNGKVLIQEALVRYFDALDVGDSVVWSKLFNPINEVAGQSVNQLLISKKGDTPSQANIELNYNQLAVITFKDINI